MSDKYFLDTNILVYSLDPVDPRKEQIAQKLVTRAVTSGLGVISYQVVQEFVNVALRQFQATMSTLELERYFFRVLLPMMIVSSSAPLFLEGLRLQVRRKFHWHDALLVAPASERLCNALSS